MLCATFASASCSPLGRRPPSIWNSARMRKFAGADLNTSICGQIQVKVAVGTARMTAFRMAEAGTGPCGVTAAHLFGDGELGGGHGLTDLGDLSSAKFAVSEPANLRTTLMRALPNRMRRQPRRKLATTWPTRCRRRIHATQVHGARCRGHLGAVPTKDSAHLHCELSVVAVRPHVYIEPCICELMSLRHCSCARALRAELSTRRRGNKDTQRHDFRLCALESNQW